MNKKLISGIIGVAVFAAAIGGAYWLGRSQSPIGGGEPGGKPEEFIQPNFAHFRIGNKNVKSIYADGKLVWVGTSGGVVRYDMTDDSFKIFDNQNGLMSNGIFWVGRIKGQITVGTYGGGMSMLDEKSSTWKHYNIPQGMGDAFVYEALEAKNGDIWVATWSGVNRIRGGDLDDRSKWDLYTVQNTQGGVPNDWIYGLAEGEDGDIWLATEGGVALFRDGKWENWNHQRGIGAPYETVRAAIGFTNDPGRESSHHAMQKKEMGLEGVDVAYNPNYIVALEVDEDGKIWVGTWGGGLSIYDGKAWKNYSTVDGLPGNHVFMLKRDQKDRMWIGTNAGLSLWRNGRFVTLNQTDGLFGNDVFSMAVADDGSLWVGSFGGVSYLKPKR